MNAAARCHVVHARDCAGRALPRRLGFPRRSIIRTVVRRAQEEGEGKVETKVKDPDYIPSQPNEEEASRKAAAQGVRVQVTTGEPAKLLKSMAGGTAPMGDVWDPISLTDGKDGNTVRRYREAELAHCRVCMLAAVGFLFGENFPIVNEIFSGGITGPAIYQFQQIQRPFWELIVFGIGIAETTRAQIGWKSPLEGLFELRPDYSPGDLSFDPLGLRPSDPGEFREMENKELNNGRLAMVAVAGMVAQELLDNQSILPVHGGG